MGYGYCPRCGAPGKTRERRPNGNDTCERGCVYPSMSSMAVPIATVDPPPPRLTREDLELVDAIVAVGAISRAAAREVVVTAQPGRVATRIMELGLCNLAGGGYVVVDRLAKYEAALADWERMAKAACDSPIGTHPSAPTGTHLDCTELHEKCPYDRRVHGQCSCGGSRNAYLSCEVHAPSVEAPETD